jgi:hypothetical protein
LVFAHGNYQLKSAVETWKTFPESQGHDCIAYPLCAFRSRGCVLSAMRCCTSRFDSTQVFAVMQMEVHQDQEAESEMQEK